MGRLLLNRAGENSGVESFNLESCGYDYGTSFCCRLSPLWNHVSFGTAGTDPLGRSRGDPFHNEGAQAPAPIRGFGTTGKLSEDDEGYFV